MLPEEYLPDDYEGPCAGPESKLIGKIMFSLPLQKIFSYFTFKQ